jgi:hypothetical protein
MSIKLFNTRQGSEAYKANHEGEVMSAHKNPRRSDRHDAFLCPCRGFIKESSVCAYREGSLVVW